MTPVRSLSTAALVVALLLLAALLAPLDRGSSVAQERPPERDRPEVPSAAERAAER